MKEKIREYLTGYIGQSIGDDESIINGHLIDSLGVLKLMLFLEKECDLDASDPDFDLESLDTLNDIMESLEA